MMTQTISQIEQVQELAQKAVREVFQTMLSLDVSIIESRPLPPDPQGEIVSSVGFTGTITGAIYLYSRVSFARVLTSRMLGITEADVDSDEMINDALGELSNMVVGSVKSQLCDGGLHCILTIPSIVRGQKLSVEKPAQVTTRVVAFAHGNQHFLAEIFVKDV